jgi:N-acetylglutamate synthase-like GNAT family acetyltransferase
VENLKLSFRKAKISDINEIYSILLKAFEPYRKNYTSGAYNATVLSPQDIKNRILGDEYEIYVVEIDKKITGTFSITKKEKNRLHIRTMAVNPDYQGRGIGLFILEKIDLLAKKNNIKTISLDTSKPLKRAIKFYENYGYNFTGVTHNFFQIKIYEMVRNI